MSAVVKLSTKLPGDEETNGLDQLAPRLVSHPHEVVVAVVWLDVPKITRDTDTDAEIPTVRVRRIEPLGGVSDTADAVKAAAAAAHEKRTGKTPLPFDVLDYEDETLD